MPLGFSPTSADPSLNPQQPCTPAIRLNLWPSPLPGSAFTTGVIFSTIAQQLFSMAILQGLSNSVPPTWTNIPHPSRNWKPPSPSQNTNTPGASPPFTSGFAQETSINSTSPFPCRFMHRAAQPLSINAFAAANRPPTAPSSIRSPTAAFFPSRPSCSSASKAKVSKATPPRAASQPAP